MSLPYFYLARYDGANTIQLDEPTSRHMVSVLRMEQGEQLNLTDGKGHLLRCTLTDVHKKKAAVRVEEKRFEPAKTEAVAIGISLVKNPSRLEWFLEKATEIGLSEIFPLLCHRTEKQHFRFDRMQQILVSAMLQSQQVWLPVLHEPLAFSNLVKEEGFAHKWIAHCLETDRRSLRKQEPAGGRQVLLIGPEGDFTQEEIELAISNGYVPVTLGDTRLRTETAGLVGATLLCIS